jgi:hypothetical protein
LATSQAITYAAGNEESYQPGTRVPFAVGIVSFLTVTAVIIHGYHPYAEDGGLYLSGVERLLNPDLYPTWSGFATANLQFSMFGPAVALLVRASGLQLMTVLFLIYVSSIWTTLFAAWHIAVRINRSVEAQCGAVVLLALWLTIPVAGTSLLVMDPYVSARSISTPCSLVAVLGILEMMRALEKGKFASWKSFGICGASILIGGAIHPLMAAYSSGYLMLLICISLNRANVRIATTVGVCVTAIVLSVCLCRLSPAQSADYARVAQTRTYWFLDSWRWYERFGLAAPLIILAATGFGRPRAVSKAAARLVQGGVFAGLTGLMVALLCARMGMSSYTIARLQPLRIFQIIYIVMILVIGGAVGERLLKRDAFRWAAMFTIMATLFAFAQSKTFPSSDHLELPWRHPTNGWEQGFLWIRSHTAENAMFAMDAHYITAPGEDSQNFRAVAERSTLPDYSKDGGVTSIEPYLTAPWIKGEAAQEGLDRASDAERIARLRHFHVEWVVLSGAASTRFDCAFENGSMKICRLPVD